MGTNAYGYAYDPIGNRLAASNNAEAIAYAANALNQYTNILSSARSAPLREVSPLFDADGNLTNYNCWSYTWDAENRLVLAVHGATVVSSQFDYMSRRVAKTSGGRTCRYLYDGWAMIQEKTGTQTNSYVYGLDLSGSMQGAGTIGGILSANLNGTQACYFFDANGNASDLADASGSSLAHYEFDPYGSTTIATGTHAAANPFRFSTKYTDEETGFLYYGYRYYAPGVGRWVNRDPIFETGFAIAAKMGKSFPLEKPDSCFLVANNPTSKTDYLGLATNAETYEQILDVIGAAAGAGASDAAGLAAAVLELTGTCTAFAAILVWARAQERNCLVDVYQLPGCDQGPAERACNQRWREPVARLAGLYQTGCLAN
jgi:RHS repeat-associated protein